MFDKVMHEDKVMGDKAAKVEELIAILLEGMGDEMGARYQPAPAPEAEDSEALVAEGQAQAGESPLPEGEDKEPDEDELAALMAALGG